MAQETSKTPMVPTEPKQPINWKRELLELIKIFFFAGITAVLINTLIICNCTVPSGSMEPTIMTGSRVLGLRLSYTFGEPKRGDIAVFKFPDDESENYVKRIIGLPGDTVMIINGSVYINGSGTPLEEPYLKEPMKGSFGPYQVPEDCYFAMGDNRNNSLDSRYWEHTYIKKEQMMAKVGLKYWPGIKVLK